MRLSQFHGNTMNTWEGRTMFFHPDLIIYLWLFPLVLLILLPLALSMIGLFLRVMDKFFFAAELTGREKRLHPRFIPYEGTFAEVSVGDTTCTGLVCNISRLGISLKHLPDKISDRVEELRVVIRGYGADHNLLVRPKWILATESGQQIGAEIDQAPPGWNQFLMQTEKISPSVPI